MRTILLFLVACSNSFAQSVSIAPNEVQSKKANHIVDGKIDVFDQITIERNGVKFGDGSKLASANNMAPLPADGFSQPIYAEFENPVILGSSTKPGYENQVVLHAANIDLQRNTNSNSPPSKINRPFLIKKSLDRASTSLMNAFENSQSLGKIIITILGPDLSGSGATIARFKYTLFNARVTDIRHLDKITTNASFVIEEEVRFAYQTLEVEDLYYSTVVSISWN